MFAVVTDTIRDFGSACAALAAIFGLLALMSRLRPARYVWRHLVTDPLGQWFRILVRSEVEDAVSEVKVQFRNNGGSTMRDAIDEIRERVGGLEQLREAGDEKLDRIEANTNSEAG